MLLFTPTISEYFHSLRPRLRGLKYMNRCVIRVETAPALIRHYGGIDLIIRIILHLLESYNHQLGLICYGPRRSAEFQKRQG